MVVKEGRGGGGGEGNETKADEVRATGWNWREVAEGRMCGRSNRRRGRIYLANLRIKQFNTFAGVNIIIMGTCNNVVGVCREWWLRKEI